MDCLLFGGAPSVGKSEAIYRLALKLIGKGFIDRLSLVPATFRDFSAVLDGVNKKGEPIRIILNSATDTTAIIQNFKNFFDLHGPYDVLVSSVRDGGFYPRQDFFSIMGISHASHYITELPMAKLTRRDRNLTTALAWYQTKIDALVQHVNSNPPFEI
ncbi:MAG: hypothetical protein JWP94_524 [Mucilaginibacter sp.]|nr:hypothetical protein [Mucilaginibacter sp.]